MSTSNLKKKFVEKFHRQTQTVDVIPVSTQTSREQGTQMNKPGVYFEDTRNDVIIDLNFPFFDSAKFDKLRLEKTIVIQSFLRGFFARRLAKRLRKERELKFEQEEMEQYEKEKEEEQKKKEDLARRMHPKTQEDFGILYNELESWRATQTENIKKQAETEDDKQDGLKELLRKEVKLLQTIDRLKISAEKEKKFESIHKKLEKMASPKIVQAHDGTDIFVETPFTIRAKELIELYHGLNTKNLTVDERLDVLLNVKWTVKEFDCDLTRQIVELINRESDLLNRGRKSNFLEGLRLRISNLFLRFIETPEFNPEAIHFQKIPLEYAIRPGFHLFFLIAFLFLSKKISPNFS